MSRYAPRGLVSLSLAALLPLGLTACGGDWDEVTFDESGLPGDAVQELSYFKGPYGTQQGDVVKNHAFAVAFRDPDTFCKDADKLDLRLNDGITSLSFLDIVRGDPFCAQKKKELLWITITTGW